MVVVRVTVQSEHLAAHVECDLHTSVPEQFLVSGAEKRLERVADLIAGVGKSEKETDEDGHLEVLQTAYLRLGARRLRHHVHEDKTRLRYVLVILPALHDESLVDRSNPAFDVVRHDFHSAVALSTNRFRKSLHQFVRTQRVHSL